DSTSQKTNRTIIALIRYIDASVKAEGCGQVPLHCASLDLFLRSGAVTVYSDDDGGNTHEPRSPMTCRCSSAAAAVVTDGQQKTRACPGFLFIQRMKYARSIASNSIRLHGRFILFLSQHRQGDDDEENQGNEQEPRADRPRYEYRR